MIERGGGRGGPLVHGNIIDKIKYAYRFACHTQSLRNRGGVIPH